AAHVSDLDTIRGKADLITRGERATLSVDLERTAWLERAAVRGEGTAARFEVRDLALQGLGVTWTGSGVVGDTLDFVSEVDVADARALHRFGVTALDSLVLSMTARVTGTREAPALEASLSASARGEAFTAPAVEATATLDAAGWTAVVAAGSATFGTFPVDSARVRLRTDGSTFSSGCVAVSVDAPRIRVREESDFALGDTTVVRIDRLELTFPQGDLAATAPATVTLRDGTTAVDGLSLAGSLGTLQADGAVGPDGSTDLRLEAAAAELPWAGGPLQWTLSARTEADSLYAHVEARRDGASRLALDATIPSARIGPDLADRLDDVTLRASFDCFPVPVTQDFLEAERVACLDGSLEGRRLRSAPQVSGAWDLSFPGWPRLEAYRLSGKVRGSGRTGASAEELEIAGIDVTTTLTRRQERVLEGAAHYAKEARAAGADGTLDVTLTSAELRLADFADLLPPDVSAQGTLAIDFHASGMASDPSLDGGVRGPVEFSMAGGTKARGRATIRLGGSLRKPTVRGDVLIERGTIQIPEAPRTLHPSGGDATLWSLRAEQESTATPAPATPPDPGTAAAAAMDLDLDVSIPSGLWIKGRGLEAELSGALGVRQQDGEPAVSGELNAQRGSLLMLGRTFRMERGGVVFDGTSRIDPELDFALTTNVDGKLFRVVFEGTAQAPRLRLESEPDMPEGDIVSYLLFGRAVNQLDTDQTSFLESRAADVAASMGLAGLETRVARELGMDLVRIRREGGASTVVLGKYLSPKALLQYEQNLVDGKGTRVNLEYLLQQGFKVDTLFGREGRSGIGLSWEKRY
ncbi:translocation/assembly module TamB, partial [bacterium]|nr:translocation/assembly module TamB [bacterium]